ncbi:MAG: LamG-like jellyroll fold domain-containing protein [Acinetobacter sp.]|uniref:LamG-like jellyroll fold domain-containing protein n=1 Tax=Acinetobacter sp. TaxID=472 RepID=UPI003982B7C1
MAAIRLEFAQFGHFDSFDVIRSITSMVGIADIDLPTPITTGLKTMYYVDSNVIKNKMYFYKVRVHRGDASFVSSEIKAYAILNESYIFKTPFAVDYADEMGNIWTPFGSATVASGALILVNSSSRAQSYLTTPLASVAWVFSTGDLTMRLKVRVDRTTDSHVIYSCRSYYNGAGFWLGFVGSDLIFATHNGSTSNAEYFQVPVSLNTTDFFPISVERKDQKYYLYFNSNLVASSSVATSITTPSAVPGFCLGVMSDDDRYFLSGSLKDFELLYYAIGDGGSQSPIF